MSLSRDQEDATLLWPPLAVVALSAAVGSAPGAQSYGIAPGQWTWVAGSSATGQPGSYGTKGVAAASNVPGSRWGAASLRDGAGRLWLFGGDTAGNFSSLANDLWQWDGAAWTWISGSDTENQPGDYGTLGAGAASNLPGARAPAAWWTDPAGRFWIFGGYGRSATSAGYLADLWKWDGSTWTWMAGPSQEDQFAGSFGTKGVAAATNFPPARQLAAAWTDRSGSLWLFGGMNGTDALGDLWKWNGSAWAWVGGSSSPNQPGVYGTPGIGAAANSPGARYGSSTWVDASGNLWLFGGYGADSTAGGFGWMNDLWKWDGSTWTWMGGAEIANPIGVYGTGGAAAAGNGPGGREGAGAWVDGTGNVWVFGGFGFDGRTDGYLGNLGDLWKWNGSAWAWMGGSDLSDSEGSYGTLGASSSSGIPGARSYAATWKDTSGNAWLLGGSGVAGGVSGLLNDLWAFGSSGGCTPPDPPAVSAPSSAAPGESGLSAAVADHAGSTYAWSVSGGTIDSGQGTSHITFTVTGNPVTLSVTESRGGCTSSPGTATVSVASGGCTPPATPTVSAPGGATPGQSGLVASVADHTGSTYTWSVAGGALTGGQGTHQLTFTAGASGAVTLTVTETNSGCASAAATAVVPISSGGCSPPATPTISAPGGATPGQSGLVASVADHAGSTYAWGVTGGTVTGGQGTHQLTFTAGASGAVALTVTETNGGCSSGLATASVPIGSSACTPPDLPVIVAPALAGRGQTGLTASVTDHTGSTFLWSISGGSLNGGQGTFQVTFVAFFGASLTLKVTETNGGCTSPQASIVVPLSYGCPPTLSALTDTPLTRPSQFIAWVSPWTTPAGKLRVLAAGLGGVEILDPATSKVTSTIPVPSWRAVGTPQGIAFSAAGFAGACAFAAGEGDKTPASSACLSEPPKSQAQTFAIASLPSGTEAVSVGGTTLHWIRYDVSANKLADLGTAPTQAPVFGLDWTGSAVAAASTTFGLELFTLEGAGTAGPYRITPRGTLPLPGTAYSVVSCGSSAWVAGYDRGLHRIDLTDLDHPKLAATYPATPSLVVDVACSGTFLTVVSIADQSGAGGDVKLYQVADLEAAPSGPLPTAAWHQTYDFATSATIAGTKLAVGRGAKPISLWNVQACSP